MLGQIAAQVILVGDDVDHARRENAGHDLANLQGGQRRGGGWLDNDRVASQQGGGQFECHQQQWEIPGNDGAHHTQR